MAADAHTVLYVPVPGLEDYIRWRHEVEGPQWLSPDAHHLHAHIMEQAMEEMKSLWRRTDEQPPS